MQCKYNGWLKSIVNTSRCMKWTYILVSERFCVSVIRSLKKHFTVVWFLIINKDFFVEVVSSKIVLQDEEDSKSVCEVRIVEVPACVWTDFVTTAVKLGRLQDIGWRNRSVSLHPLLSAVYILSFCSAVSGRCVFKLTIVKWAFLISLFPNIQNRYRQLRRWKITSMNWM